MSRHVALSAVTVTARHGGRLQRIACALGIHDRLSGQQVVGGDAEGPATIQYCIWCAESSDPRWVWVGTVHDGALSFVEYRAAGGVA